MLLNAVFRTLFRLKPQKYMHVNEKLEGVLTAGTHGSTFGGNPVACAGGLAVLDRIESEGFLDSVSAKAEHFRERLEKCSEVAEVTARIIRGYCEKHPPALQIEQKPEEPSEQPETAEHETAPQQPAPVRLTGKVKLVRKGRKTCYAYIKGSDGSEYTVTEDEFAKTPDAANIIKAGATVSFVPNVQPNRKPLAAEIRHAP